MRPLNVGSRLRQIAPMRGVNGVGAGGGAAGVPFPPTLAATFTYFTPSPSTCYTDAGTTPAAVGDLVYRIVSSYGPAGTTDQTTAGNRMTLRQTLTGKYYLEGAAGKSMSGSLALGTGNVTITLAVASRSTSSAALAGAVSYGNSIAGAMKAVGLYANLRTAGKISVEFAGNNQFDTTASSDLNTDQSIIVTKAAGTVAASTTLYRNGTAAASAGTPSVNVPAIATQTLWIGPFAGDVSACFEGRIYGFGATASALSAGDVALLDTYQQSRY